jgi:hypothetical protein
MWMDPRLDGCKVDEINGLTNVKTLVVSHEEKQWRRKCKGAGRQASSCTTNLVNDLGMDGYPERYDGGL